MQKAVQTLHKCPDCGEIAAIETIIQILLTFEDDEEQPVLAKGFTCGNCDFNFQTKEQERALINQFQTPGSEIFTMLGPTVLP